MSEIKSIREAGAWLGVSRTTAGNHLRHKRFPLKREAPWSQDEMGEWKAWSKTLRPDRSKPGESGKLAAPASPAEEKDKDYWLMRKYRAQALEQEGRLLDADAVMRAWSQTIGDIRDQLLLMPAAVQGLMGLSNDQTKTLDDFTRRTLEGVADRMGNLAEDAGFAASGSEVNKTAKAAKPKRVGRKPPVHAKVNDRKPRAVEK